MPYSGDPSDSKADELRFLIGDIDPTTVLFSDAEITYTLGLYSDNVLVSASYLSNVQAMRYAEKRDRAVGPLSVNYDAQFQRWTQMAERFQKLAAKGIDGKGSTPNGRIIAPVELFGGGVTYLGPDDTPLTYNEGENTDVVG